MACTRRQLRTNGRTHGRLSFSEMNTIAARRTVALPSSVRFSIPPPERTQTITVLCSYCGYQSMV